MREVLKYMWGFIRNKIFIITVFVNKCILPSSTTFNFDHI